MAGFSDYLEDKVLDHVFGGNAYTAPSTLYVALYTVAPSIFRFNSGDLGGGTEVSGGSYARQTANLGISTGVLLGAQKFNSFRHRPNNSYQFSCY